MAGRPGHGRAAFKARPPQEHRERLTISGPGVALVQVFGRKDSRDTQKALRFFKERRVPVSYVDLSHKQLAPTELRRFTSRLGARELLDESSRAYLDSGLGYMRLGDDDIFDRLLGNQALIRLPLVRADNNVSVGVDERTWRSWLSPS